MKRLLIVMLAVLMSLAANAQEGSFMSHLYLPVDAGVSFGGKPGIGGAFYMRASLEYRPNVHKGLFVVAELDTRTHPYTDGGIVSGNVAAGDGAFTDILIGPGWRFMCSDSFKIALALQGGATNLAYKEVATEMVNNKYVLNGRDYWSAAAKGSVMFEYYLNPKFDLFLNVGVPACMVPMEYASMDELVFFPTVSLGFIMALE